MSARPDPRPIQPPSAPAAPEGAAPAPLPDTAADERLRWLFRDSHANGQVHPLEPLLRRYRNAAQTGGQP